VDPDERMSVILSFFFLGGCAEAPDPARGRPGRCGPMGASPESGGPPPRVDRLQPAA